MTGEKNDKVCLKFLVNMVLEDQAGTDLMKDQLVTLDRERA